MNMFIVLNDMSICAKTHFVRSVRKKHTGENMRPATGADPTADKGAKSRHMGPEHRNMPNLTMVLPLYHMRY